MNFLAHCYLSGNSEELLIGNFIADSVRGSKFKDYSAGICLGIRLHRLIDEFTDTHQVVKQSKSRLYQNYGKYAAVIVDVFYDHFLAVDWNIYSSQDLSAFIESVYETMHSHGSLIPDDVNKYLPYMISQNWLYNYREIRGIEKSLKGLSRRSKFNVKMEQSVSDLKNNYEAYRAEFNAFFPELILYVETTMKREDFRHQC